MNLSNIDIKELAGLICDTLKKENIDAVLVGGACVSIYSENRYQSYDLDFVSYQEMKSIEKALEKLGFIRTGRCFRHKDCPFLIDFQNLKNWARSENLSNELEAFLEALGK